MAKILSPRNMLVLPRGNRKPAKFLLDPFHTLSRGLVAYYPLGDNAAGITSDVSQYGKNANVVASGGSPTLVGSHHGGLSFSTNTTTSYCSADNPPALTYPLTFSIWANLRVAVPVNSVEVMLCVADKTSLNEFWIDLSNAITATNVRVVAQQGATQRIFITNSSVPLPGAWHNYTGIFRDSSTFEMNVDGILQPGTYIATGAPVPTGLQTTFIGALIYNSINLYGNFDGFLEGARIWNRALSPSEIQLLYAEPYAGVLQFPVDLFGGNTVVTSAGTITLDIAVAGGGVTLLNSVGSIALDIAVSGVGTASAASIGSIGLAIAVSGAGASAATSAASVTLNIAVASTGAARVTAVGSVSLLIAVSGVGVAGRLGAGAVFLHVAIAGVGRSAATSIGSVSLNIAILGYMVDANIRYLPVYTIMRNSVTPAAGSMDNEIVACEGTFY